MTNAGKAMQCDVESFVARVRNQHLADLLRNDPLQKGVLIYSSRYSFGKSPVTFLGFNPGQDPLVEHPSNWTLSDSIQDFLTRNGSLVQSEPWIRSIGGGIITEYPPGEAPYQLGTRALIDSIGQSDALVTNLYFVQTPDINGLANLPQHIRVACWNVHLDLMACHDTRVIIACSAVVQRLRRFFDLQLQPQHTVPAQRNNDGWWSCRLLEGRYPNTGGKRITVLQIPHFSRYRIYRDNARHVLRWASKHVDAALAE